MPNIAHHSSLLRTTTFSAASLLLLAADAFAQYTPPPPPSPFPGFINEALRADDPYMNAWDFGGFARFRYEHKDGNGIPGVPGSLDFRELNADTHNAYFIERLQLRAAYTDTWWSILTEARSSLSQGDERSAFAGNPRHKGQGPEYDPIDLHQAVVSIGNHKEFPLSLKVGRQELSYADERFIGSFIWNNIGRVFDAAKLRWQNAWFAADLFTSRPVVPVDNSFNKSNDYETFSGIYATSPLVPHHSLDVFLLSRNVTPDSTAAFSHPEVPLPSARDIYSIGARLKSKPGDLGAWDYFVDAVGQFGNFRDIRAGAPSYRLDHQAMAFIANVGYTFPDCPATPRLALEYAYGSGDSDPRDGSHGTFDNLYPTNHKFYGYADFASLQNLHDIRPILTLKPTARLSVALEGHLFWLADSSDSFYNVAGVPRGGVNPTSGNGYGINPSYDTDLGTEIDLIAGYALTRYAQVEAGYCHFFTGSYIDASLANPNFGSSDADYFYLQFMLRF